MIRIKVAKYGDYEIYRYFKETPTPVPVSIKGKTIKEVIYNDPATIIIWSDGTKTVAKCEGGDVYDREKGFYICLLKELLGKKFMKIYSNECKTWEA